MKAEREVDSWTLMVSGSREKKNKREGMRVRMSERKERGGKDGKTLTEVE